MGSVEIEIEDSQIDAVQCAVSLPSSDESNGPRFVILPWKGYIVEPSMDLHLLFTVEKVTGTGPAAKVEPIASVDKVAIINYGMMTMWKSIEMEVNGTPVISPNALAPYIALIRAYEELDVDARSSKLAASGWYPDTAGLHEKYTTTMADNPAFYQRHFMITDAKDVEFYGPVMLGPLLQKKPFADDVTIVLKFNRAPAEFVLLGEIINAANVTFRITIKKAVLYVKRSKISNGATLGREISYRFNSYDTAHYVLKAEKKSFSQEFLVGPCPNRVIALMVNQKAFTGELTKNPFYFPTNLVASLFLKKDNRTCIPTEPFTAELEISSAGTKYISCVSRLYFETMKVLNDARWMSHASIGISQRDFLFGQFIMGFDLRALPNSNESTKRAVLRYDITFHEPLEEDHILILLLEYDRTLVIPSGPKRGEVQVV